MALVAPAIGAPGRGIQGQLRPMMNDPLMAPYLVNMSQLVGRTLPILDNSQLMRDTPGYHLDWTMIDELYKSRPLIAMEPIATADYLNQLRGLALVANTMQITLTHERYWKTKSRERIMVGLTALSPTGIPRSSTFTEHTREGYIGRYGHFHTIPNEKLADPNFGPQAFLDMTSDFKSQFMHQVILDVSQALAAQPHLTLVEKGRRTSAASFSFLSPWVGCVCARPPHITHPW